LNAPDPVDPRQIVLSMRRAASRIVQAEGEDAVLRELHQGAQSLAGTCPVALHRSRERARAKAGPWSLCWCTGPSARERW
jgi:hypothetical protein